MAELDEHDLAGDRGVVELDIVLDGRLLLAAALVFVLKARRTLYNVGLRLGVGGVARVVDVDVDIGEHDQIALLDAVVLVALDVVSALLGRSPVRDERASLGASGRHVVAVDVHRRLDERSLRRGHEVQTDGAGLLGGRRHRPTSAGRRASESSWPCRRW